MDKRRCNKFFRNRIKDSIDSSFGIIKPEALSYFDSVVTGGASFDYTYWRIIMFSEWMKNME